MPSAWTIVTGGHGDSGPTWDAMATSSTDEYEDLTEHYWEWTRDWELLGQFGYLGGKWGTKTTDWPDTTDAWRLLNWEIIEKYKSSGATNWGVITNTKTITGTEL